jgi:phage replication-related protein YjqB (UPF0714/DUF867 family)
MPNKEDQYNCFEDLAAGEVEGVDYRIRVTDRNSRTAIVAPHGGTIEPNTSQISLAIAAGEFSLYCFEGLKSNRPHSDLHITSDRFNEPQACRLVSTAEFVIGVHGRADNKDKQTVWVGGLNFDLRDLIVRELTLNRFRAVVRKPGETLAGASQKNICNRGASKAGVQLEIPQTLRVEIGDDARLLAAFASSVRKAIGQYAAKTEACVRRGV